MDQLEDKTVTLRKPCYCHGCARRFGRGESIRKVTWVDAGVFGHSCWCETCSDYWTKHMEYDDDINFGDLKSSDPEEWEKVRQENETN